MPIRTVGTVIILLIGRLFAQSATQFPTVDSLPFHLTNYSTEVAHKSGSGTAFVNFVSSYPDSLDGAKILLKDDQTDSLLMRLDLDSALNIKSTSLDTPAVVTLGFHFNTHVMHATAFYLNASAFNVLENFTDSTVLKFEAFFSNDGFHKTFVDSLRLVQDIRNARFFSTQGSSTPIAVPTNPMVRSLTAPGSTTSMDLMRIPLDTSYVRFGLDSVRFTVPRLRKVFITSGGVISVDGGVRVYGLSVATKYSLATTYFSQSNSLWADTLINNLPLKKMSNLGCAVTSCAMLLRSLNIRALDGTDLTPLKLLQWLNSHNGFKSSTASLDWPAIANFSRASFTANGSNQPQLTFRRFEKSADSIEKYLSWGIPVVTRVRSPRLGGDEHFVLSKGIGVRVDGGDSLRGTYLVDDPGFSKSTLMGFFTHSDPVASSTNHPNRFTNSTLFSIAQTDHPNYEWVEINVHSPAELVVTDPAGRRVGFDPGQNVHYDEIPSAQYYLDGPIDDIVDGSQSTLEIKSVYISQPISGDYKVKVIGTGTGSYEVSMSKSNRLGTSITKLPSTFGSTYTGKVDSGFVSLPTGTIPAWVLKLNGTMDSLTLTQGDSLRLTVDIDPGSNAGQSVDIRLFVKNTTGQTYYLSLPNSWGSQNVPTYSGSLPQVSNYWVNTINTQSIATGLYTFYFEIDYDHDGFAEQVDSAKVLVQ